MIKLLLFDVDGELCLEWKRLRDMQAAFKPVGDVQIYYGPLDDD